MQTIDIRTTQNVTIEYELASLRERALALLVDWLIVGVFYFVLLFLLVGAFGDALFRNGFMVYFVYIVLPFGGFMAYQFFSEMLANGQSWGKKAMGIKVVRVDGAEPGLSDYFLRAIFHIMDTFTFGVIGALLISSSPKNQRLGDMTANTTVIRVRHQVRFRLEDILKISSIENYQPVYPEVRRLSEQDMLLIKHLLTRYRQFPNPAHAKAVNEAVAHLTDILHIEEKPQDKIEFLKTLIRDYIVLTR